MGLGQAGWRGPGRGGQHQTVEVNRYADKEALQRGPAYVQFCLYTVEGENFFGASSNDWVKVKQG